MEPITLCGLIIVAFGLWMELEPAVMVIVKRVCGSRLFTAIISQSTVQKPVYVRKMPICFAKASFY